MSFTEKPESDKIKIIVFLHKNAEYTRRKPFMKVLIINCGSSSLKYQIIDSDTEQVQAKGLCERIGIDGRLIYQPAGG